MTIHTNLGTDIQTVPPLPYTYSLGTDIQTVPPLPHTSCLSQIVTKVKEKSLLEAVSRSFRKDIPIPLRNPDNHCRVHKCNNNKKLFLKRP